MGDIADMMLDGTMCQICGEWMDGGEDGPGFPMTCAGCGGDDLGLDDDEFAPMPTKTQKQKGSNTAPKVWACSNANCKKRFRRKIDAKAHCIARQHGDPVDTSRKLEAA